MIVEAADSIIITSLTLLSHMSNECDRSDEIYGN